jgi:hypothetical protein
MSYSISPTSPVEDAEILYRSVRLSDGGYKDENGTIKISSSAFNDRKMQPSVDRATLKNNEPKNSQKSPTDCVVSLITKDIREEKIERNGTEYVLDVRPYPNEENQAHAIIVSSPEYQNEKAFRKVKEKLSRLAKLILPPTN